MSAETEVKRVYPNAALNFIGGIYRVYTNSHGKAGLLGRSVVSEDDAWRSAVCGIIPLTTAPTTGKEEGR